MKRSLEEIAHALGARLLGPRKQAAMTGVASIESAGQHDLVFVEEQKHLAAALNSRAGAVITREFPGLPHSEQAVLIVEHPKLAFARAARLFDDTGSEMSSHPVVHSAAVVHPTAVLAAGVSVEACAVIQEKARLGVGTTVGSGSTIGAGVTVGEKCVFYSNVTIYPGTFIGNRVVVHAGAVLGSDGFGYVRDRTNGRYEKFPQVGRLVIEDDVEIGANATVDRGALDETRIRRGAKIDNLVHVGHNCEIGEDVVIAAQTGLSGSIVIENGAVLGGQVGIGEHARVGEGVMLGGQGGVLPNKILRGKGQAFWGTPAQPLRQYLKQLATLARLADKE
jgi:UDP-3-O-[3-hydroxymyristoyl] glucosamine N-acyltransferase